MKLFLATSFSTKVNSAGQVLPEFRAEMEELLVALRGDGKYTVFCAVEHDNWRISSESAGKVMKDDCVQIDASDVLIALLHDSVSAGVQFEIGYAIAKQKRIILASALDVKLGYVNQGLVEAGLAQHVSYSNNHDIARLVAT